MSRIILSCCAITLLALTAHHANAVVVVGTDFTNRQIFGNVADNITWTTNGVIDPGPMQVDAPDGLFDTPNAQGHFAPDRNTGNEGPWTTSIQLIPTVDNISVSDVELDWQHFNNGGAFQGPDRSVDWTATLTGSTSGVIDSVTNLNVTGVSGVETLMFSSPIALTTAQSYLLEITAQGSNTTGNNTGLDAFFVNGTVPGVVEPTTDYRDAVLADGPFAYYRLNEPGGSVAANSGTVGNALDATINNQGSFTFNTPTLLPNGEDSAIAANGGGEVEIRIPDNAALNTGAHDNKSISIWFNAPEVTTTRQVLFEQGGNTRGINIYVEEVNGVDTLFMGAWNLAESNWPVTFVSTPIVEGQTHNAVWVLEGNPDGDAGTDDGGIFGFLDGELFQSVGGAGQLRAHGNNTGIFGIFENARFADNSTMGNGLNFAGTIDELALYNIALSADQVAAQYAIAAAGVPEPATAMLALLGVGGLMIRRRRVAT